MTRTAWITASSGISASRKAGSATQPRWSKRDDRSSGTMVRHPSLVASGSVAALEYCCLRPAKGSSTARCRRSSANRRRSSAAFGSRVGSRSHPPFVLSMSQSFKSVSSARAATGPKPLAARIGNGSCVDGSSNWLIHPEAPPGVRKCIRYPSSLISVEPSIRATAGRSIMTPQRFLRGPSS
jgi:hypothetical protein